MRNMGLKDFVLPVVTNASFFNIYHCDENGRPDKRYHPHSAMSTYVSNFANVTRRMAQTPTTLGALLDQATEYAQASPKAWFLEGSDIKEKKISKAAKTFQGFSEDDFPSMMADGSMRNRGNSASHPRREWKKPFKLSSQLIRFNEVSLRHMISAAIVADTTSDKNHSKHQEYRTWVFTMASVALHEISHILITYLSNILETKPPSMKARVGSSADNEKGEAGRDLEERVFGGILTFRREPHFATADQDCGVPYLITRTRGCYRITKKMINRTVECDFEFPYAHTGIDERHYNLKPLDFDKPMNKPKHPLEHPDWPKIRDFPLPNFPSTVPA